MDAIRNMYSELGVDEFYKEYGNEYTNPHADIIKKLLTGIDAGDYILDLCCGSGEVTRCFPDKHIIGCDPYTHELYKKLTNREVLTFSFKDIALGALAEYSFDTVICSFDRRANIKGDPHRKPRQGWRFRTLCRSYHINVRKHLQR